MAKRGEDNFLTFLETKRRFRESCLGWREERVAADEAVASVLVFGSLVRIFRRLVRPGPVFPGRYDGAPESGALAGRVFVAEAVSEGGGRVVNHAEEIVGERVETEIDVAASSLVVVKVTTFHG